ncbi:hypothetical protein C7H19_15100 [Aphanothece hegewaldii CCALA 016]|uniref:Uncharacterized protein n=1 Tax=Aphanothece hegewaldii CCALA 016 TaxID=2107694 RepID=A0A2T1LVJ3_9CHRO|nr:ArdC-like ssDNA-binding domain-containing protein [Aphanothece hegewaldii]PSF35751.1 hypothetical protein C7H19_15100 [Aphanothece hegewaldii CCALA 016]
MVAVAPLKSQEALAKLEQGLTDLLASGDWQKYLKFQSSFHHYSFNNSLLIMIQCPIATRVMGYQQWLSFGRQVRKGEKAISILAPLKQKIEKEDGSDPSYRLAGFKIANVFDISQTEGEPLPTIASLLVGDDRGLVNKLADFTRWMNISLQFEKLSSANGYCRFNADGTIVIVVDSRLSPRQTAKTLTHELAHALMHDYTTYSQHNGLSVCELEAESVAHVVLDRFGLDTSEYSYGYICSWAKKEAIAILKSSGAKIQQAAQRIIDWIER